MNEHFKCQVSVLSVSEYFECKTSVLSIISLKLLNDCWIMLSESFKWVWVYLESLKQVLSVLTQSQVF